MMKQLLGTTALLGSVLFASSQASAEAPAMSAPKLTISGQSSFNAWWFHNKKQNVTVGNEDANPSVTNTFTEDQAQSSSFGKGYLFTVDDSRLKFDVNGKTDPGMEYGLTIVVNGDTNQTKSIKENYVWFGGSWGKLTLGDAEGVDRTMAFGGFDPLGGTGGFDGNFDRVVNFTTGTLNSVNLAGDTVRSTKATYQTPRWKGFQAGVSYTPRTEHRGEAFQNSRSSYESPKAVWGTHSIAAALNFIHKFNNGFEMALSGTALFDQANAPIRKETVPNVNVYDQLNQNNLNPLTIPRNFDFGNKSNPKFNNGRSFAFGALFDYKGWELGAEYGHNGKSHQFKGAQKGAWFADVGLSYAWGATKLSTGYYYGQIKTFAVNAAGTLSSGRVKAKTNIYTAAIDHKLAPGVGVFFEYAHYHMKNKGATADAADLSTFGRGNASASYTLATKSDTANAFVLGTKIKF